MRNGHREGEREPGSGMNPTPCLRRPPPSDPAAAPRGASQRRAAPGGGQARQARPASGASEAWAQILPLLLRVALDYSIPTRPETELKKEKAQCGSLGGGRATGPQPGLGLGFSLWLSWSQGPPTWCQGSPSPQVRGPPPGPGPTARPSHTGASGEGKELRLEPPLGQVPHTCRWGLRTHLLSRASGGPQAQLGF